MELSLVHVSENQKAISWLSALAGATIPIADLGDLEGGEPGAPVRWERRHPAGLG